MSKVTDFYAKALADESAKKKLITILGDNRIEEASDEQLAKVGELAKQLGFDITIEEAKAYLSGNNAELDEEDLDAVAGGGKGTYVRYISPQEGIDTGEQKVYPWGTF
ncbi:MAG: hypothetical protein ACI4JN_00980 [Ruminococcus sp.]